MNGERARPPKSPQPQNPLGVKKKVFWKWERGQISKNKGKKTTQGPQAKSPGPEKVEAPWLDDTEGRKILNKLKALYLTNTLGGRGKKGNKKKNPRARQTEYNPGRNTSAGQ